jgi:hypothetical protein
MKSTFSLKSNIKFILLIPNHLLIIEYILIYSQKYLLYDVDYSLF